MLVDFYFSFIFPQFNKASRNEEDLLHFKKSVYYLDKLQNLLGIRPSTRARSDTNRTACETLYNRSEHIGDFLKS